MTTFVCLVCLVGCGAPRAGGPASVTPSAQHLVLVTIDTLRADRLGCYGSRTVSTPHMDRLAAEGTMARHATVHAPLTRPSHASLFTGLLPTEHGIRDNISPPLAPGLPTLAGALQQAGFHTAAFVSSVVLSSQSGLAHGFDVYGEDFPAGHSRFLDRVQKRGDVTLQEAMRWLREPRAPGRLFLWLHLYDPHHPYEPPEPYAARYAGRPYDGEVAFSDELVGRLDSELSERGLSDSTLFIVTSDHGEDLGDHGETGHGLFVYESTLAVPLLVRGPGVARGGRVDLVARTIDLLPTALELLGVRPPSAKRLPGRSLAGALQGGRTPPEVASYAESLMPALQFGWSDLRALREGRWKYIQAPKPELYDLRDDPGEKRNLVQSQPDRARVLSAGLAELISRERAANPLAPTASGVPPDMFEKLGALGYVGAGGPGQTRSPGADPKDMLAEYKLVNRLVREGLVALRENDYPKSAARFQELLARGIETFEVHHYLGRALMGLRRHRAAAPHFVEAIRLQPAQAESYRELADCKAAMGDLRGALTVLREGRRVDPKDATILDAEAGAWLRLGNRKEAIRAFQEALPLAPRSVLLRMRLGELLRDQGDLAGAAQMMRAAVALDDAKAAHWATLGGVLAVRGELADAAEAFAQAERRDGRHAGHAYNRGLMLLRLGRPAEARPHFRRALELQPGFALARERLSEIAVR